MNKDRQEEMFPWVDTEGRILGCVSRGEAHGGGKKLHPVVHLHLFNPKGELYLQKRPLWKDIQPGKWDTACGGHVDYGEPIPQALSREVREELGISRFTPVFIRKYVFESRRERELVHVHAAVYSGEVRPAEDELDGGRYWTVDEIKAAMGTGVFTPNFESEFTHTLLPYLEEQERQGTPLFPPTP